MNYLLPEEFRKGLIDYFSERPYKEAAQAIALLQSLKPETCADAGSTETVNP